MKNSLPPPIFTVGPNRPISDIEFTLTDQTTQKDASEKVNFGLQAPFSLQMKDGEIENSSKTDELFLSEGWRLDAAK